MSDRTDVSRWSTRSRKKAFSTDRCCSRFSRPSSRCRQPPDASAGVTREDGVAGSEVNAVDARGEGGAISGGTAAGPLLWFGAEPTLVEEEARMGPRRLSRSWLVSSSVLGRWLKSASTRGAAAASRASEEAAGDRLVALSARMLRSIVAFSTCECQPASTRRSSQRAFRPSSTRSIASRVASRAASRAASALAMARPFRRAASRSSIKSRRI